MYSLDLISLLHTASAGALSCFWRRTMLSAVANAADVMMSRFAGICGQVVGGTFDFEEYRNLSSRG